jgi:hypothetical protein
MITISAVSQGLGTALELLSEESASQVRKVVSCCFEQFITMY